MGVVYLREGKGRGRDSSELSVKFRGGKRAFLKCYDEGTEIGDRKHTHYVSGENNGRTQLSCLDEVFLEDRPPPSPSKRTDAPERKKRKKKGKGSTLLSREEHKKGREREIVWGNPKNKRQGRLESLCHKEGQKENGYRFLWKRQERPRTRKPWF